MAFHGRQILSNFGRSQGFGDLSVPYHFIHHIRYGRMSVERPAVRGETKTLCTSRWRIQAVGTSEFVPEISAPFPQMKFIRFCLDEEHMSSRLPGSGAAQLSEAAETGRSGVQELKTTETVASIEHFRGGFVFALFSICFSICFCAV